MSHRCCNSKVKCNRRKKCSSNCTDCKRRRPSCCKPCKSSTYYERLKVKRCFSSEEKKCSKSNKKKCGKCKNKCCTSSEINKSNCSVQKNFKDMSYSLDRPKTSKSLYYSKYRNQQLECKEDENQRIKETSNNKCCSCLDACVETDQCITSPASKRLGRDRVLVRRGLSKSRYSYKNPDCFKSSSKPKKSSVKKKKTKKIQKEAESSSHNKQCRRYVTVNRYFRGQVQPHLNFAECNRNDLDTKHEKIMSPLSNDEIYQRRASSEPRRVRYESSMDSDPYSQQSDSNFRSRSLSVPARNIPATTNMINTSPELCDNEEDETEDDDELSIDCSRRSRGGVDQIPHSKKNRSRYLPDDYSERVERNDMDYNRTNLKFESDYEDKEKTNKYSNNYNSSEISITMKEPKKNRTRSRYMKKRYPAENEEKEVILNIDSSMNVKSISADGVGSSPLISVKQNSRSKYFRKKFVTKKTKKKEKKTAIASTNLENQFYCKSISNPCEKRTVKMNLNRICEFNKPNENENDLYHHENPNRSTVDVNISLCSIRSNDSLKPENTRIPNSNLRCRQCYRSKKNRKLQTTPVSALRPKYRPYNSRILLESSEHLLNHELPAMNHRHERNCTTSYYSDRNWAAEAHLYERRIPPLDVSCIMLDERTRAGTDKLRQRPENCTELDREPPQDLYIVASREGFSKSNQQSPQRYDYKNYQNCPYNRNGQRQTMYRSPYKECQENSTGRNESKRIKRYPYIEDQYHCSVNRGPIKYNAYEYEPVHSRIKEQSEQSRMREHNDYETHLREPIGTYPEHQKFYHESLHNQGIPFRNRYGIERNYDYYTINRPSENCFERNYNFPQRIPRDPEFTVTKLRCDTTREQYPVESDMSCKKFNPQFSKDYQQSEINKYCNTPLTPSKSTHMPKRVIPADTLNDSRLIRCSKKDVEKSRLRSKKYFRSRKCRPKPEIHSKIKKTYSSDIDCRYKTINGDNDQVTIKKYDFNPEYRKIHTNQAVNTTNERCSRTNQCYQVGYSTCSYLPQSARSQASELKFDTSNYNKEVPPQSCKENSNELCQERHLGKPLRSRSKYIEHKCRTKLKKPTAISNSSNSSRAEQCNNFCNNKGIETQRLSGRLSDITNTAKNISEKMICTLETNSKLVKYWCECCETFVKPRKRIRKTLFTECVANVLQCCVPHLKVHITAYCCPKCQHTLIKFVPEKRSNIKGCMDS